MGFFSDLKEDLSQAVNELMPDEEQKGTDVKKEEALSLDEMLKNIDSIELPEEEPEVEEKPEVNVADVTMPEGVSEEAELTEAPERKTAEEEDVAKTAKEEDLANAVKETMTVTQAQEAENTDNMDIESMLENVLAEEPVQEENKQESKGVEKIMDSLTSRNVSDETAIITMGMTITGDMVSEGSADIIGCVNGNIDVLGKLNVTGYINGNSKAAEIYAEGAKINGEIVSEGAVKIGASSVIIGNITATSAAIAGAVKGDIDVKGPVVLDASAIVMGNIKSKSVQINNGAVIEGMCSQCYADVSPTSFFDDYKPETKKAKQK